MKNATKNQLSKHHLYTNPKSNVVVSFKHSYDTKEKKESSM